MKYNQKIFYKNDIQSMVELKGEIINELQSFKLTYNKIYAVKFNKKYDLPQGIRVEKYVKRNNTFTLKESVSIAFNLIEDASTIFFKNTFSNEDEFLIFFGYNNKFGKFPLPIEEINETLVLFDEIVSSFIITAHEYYNENSISNSVFYNNITNNIKPMIAYKTKDRYYEFKSPKEIDAKASQFYATPRLEVDSDYIMIEYYTEE